MNAVFTVATIDYFPQAKTLAQSFCEHNPDYKFFICFVSMTSLNVEEFADRIKHIYAENLNDFKLFEEQKKKYSTFEFVCSLKPIFALHLLENYPEIETLKYMDNDILVFNKLEDDYKRADICLTPHYFQSVNPKNAITSDKNLLGHGIFNAGFFEVRNSQNAKEFLVWWKDVLKDFCTVKPPYFADQKWLDLVPLFFENVEIINHLGYNAASYNLHERILEIKSSKFVVNKDFPLVFFHFTGYKPEISSTFSINHPYVPPNQNIEVLDELHNIYKNKLIENGYVTSEITNDDDSQNQVKKWTVVIRKLKELLWLILRT